MPPETPNSSPELTQSQIEKVDAFLQSVPEKRREMVRAKIIKTFAPINQQQRIQELVSTLPENERETAAKELRRAANPDIVSRIASSTINGAKTAGDIAIYPVKSGVSAVGTFLNPRENTKDLKEVIKSPFTVTKYIGSQAVNAAKGTVEGLKAEKGKGLGRVTSMPGRFVRWLFAKNKS